MQWPLQSSPMLSELLLLSLGFFTIPTQVRTSINHSYLLNLAHVSVFGKLAVTTRDDHEELTMEYLNTRKSVVCL